MEGEEKHRGRERAANDNGPPDGDAGSESGNNAAARLDAVVLTIARLIGRQIAREHFEALQAANDNTSPTRHEPDGKDT